MTARVGLLSVIVHLYDVAKWIWYGLEPSREMFSVAYLRHNDRLTKRRETFRTSP